MYKYNIIDLAQVFEGKRTGEENWTLKLIENVKVRLSQQTVIARVYVQNCAESETILYQGIVLPNIIDLAQVFHGKWMGEENLTLIQCSPQDFLIPLKARERHLPRLTTQRAFNVWHFTSSLCNEPP